MPRDFDFGTLDCSVSAAILRKAMTLNWTPDLTGTSSKKSYRVFLNRVIENFRTFENFGNGESTSPAGHIQLIIPAGRGNFSCP